MIKAIAWDIDGTLVDSEPLHLAALEDVCKAYAVDIADLDDTHFVGVHIGDVWEELRPRFPAHVSFADWSQQLNAAYTKNSDQLVEIAGAKAVIQTLAANKLCQVAVSNSNRRVVDANLDAIGVSEFMAFTISLDDVCEGKPDPFPYRLACAKLGLNSTEVLAVEDSATGAASAIAAGMPVAFLHRPAGREEHGVTAISDLSEILELAKIAQGNLYSE